ncbi:hypothetical protein HK101_004896, partial [Irineochytrium annulatum]
DAALSNLKSARSEETIGGNPLTRVEEMSDVSSARVDRSSRGTDYSFEPSPMPGLRAEERVETPEPPPPPAPVKAFPQRPPAKQGPKILVIDGLIIATGNGKLVPADAPTAGDGTGAAAGTPAIVMKEERAEVEEDEDEEKDDNDDDVETDEEEAFNDVAARTSVLSNPYLQQPAPANFWMPTVEKKKKEVEEDNVDVVSIRTSVEIASRASSVNGVPLGRGPVEGGRRRAASSAAQSDFSRPTSPGGQYDVPFDGQDDGPGQYRGSGADFASRFSFDGEEDGRGVRSRSRQASIATSGDGRDGSAVMGEWRQAAGDLLQPQYNASAARGTAVTIERPTQIRYAEEAPPPGLQGKMEKEKGKGKSFKDMMKAFTKRGKKSSKEAVGDQQPVGSPPKRSLELGLKRAFTTTPSPTPRSFTPVRTPESSPSLLPFTPVRTPEPAPMLAPTADISTIPPWNRSDPASQAAVTPKRSYTLLRNRSGDNLRRNASNAVKARVDGPPEDVLLPTAPPMEISGPVAIQPWTDVRAFTPPQRTLSRSRGQPAPRGRRTPEQMALVRRSRSLGVMSGRPAFGRRGYDEDLQEDEEDGGDTLSPLAGLSPLGRVPALQRSSSLRAMAEHGVPGSVVAGRTMTIGRRPDDRKGVPVRSRAMTTRDAEDAAATRRDVPRAEKRMSVNRRHSLSSITRGEVDGHFVQVKVMVETEVIGLKVSRTIGFGVLKRKVEEKAAKVTGRGGRKIRAMFYVDAEGCRVLVADDEDWCACLSEVVAPNRLTMGVQFE